MEPVCWNLEFHIWQLLLKHLADQTSLDLFYASAVGFQDKKPRMNRSFLLWNSHFANQTVAVAGDTPGVITYDFPNADRHIMRAVLSDTAKLDRSSMLQSLSIRSIDPQVAAELIPLIESQDQDWFASVFATMLTQVGVGLSPEERTQLIENLTWFRQTFRT